MNTFASAMPSFPAMPAAIVAAGYMPTDEGRVASAAFAHALIALGAKLATIDGAANPAEYNAFHALFVARSGMDSAHARSLFVARAADSSSALQYARQIAAMTADDTALHKDLLHRLVQVALADAPLNAAELELLRAVADVLGIAREDFRALMAQGFAAPTASPYDVLGISPRATDQELREQYRARVQTLHPDRYQAAGASAETMAMLSDQLAAVTAAYRAVQQSRAGKTSRSAASWWGLQNIKGASTQPV